MNAAQKSHLEKLNITPVAWIAVAAPVAGIVCVANRRGRFVAASYLNSDRPSFFGGQYATPEEAKAAAVKGRTTTGDWADA